MLPLSACVIVYCVGVCAKEVQEMSFGVIRAAGVLSAVMFHADPERVCCIVQGVVFGRQILDLKHVSGC